MATKLDQDTREIANRLGSCFAVFAGEFLPPIAAALPTTDREISFGATVKCKLGRNGVVEGKLVPHEPRIPTPKLDDVPFVLNLEGTTGQLSFLFPGTVKEMRAEIDARDVKPPDDGYQPSDNTSET